MMVDVVMSIQGRCLSHELLPYIWYGLGWNWIRWGFDELTGWTPATYQDTDTHTDDCRHGCLVKFEVGKVDLIGLNEHKI